MLSLLRKYQTSIFLVVTIMVIASFLFFGVSNSLRGFAKESDFVYGKALDRSKIYGQEIARLSRFLDSDLSDLMVFENKGLPNLLNDGTMIQEIMKPGVAKEIYQRFHAELIEEIQPRFQRFRAYTPYIHPQKMIGVESVWRQFGTHSQLAENWDVFKDLGPEMSSEAFEALCNLYETQKQFPPRILRQILLYQEQQYGDLLPKDPYLQNGDLSLFHAKTIQEWFGPKFLEFCALFIHNGAIYAKQLGYQVSLGEAKTHLIETCMKGIRQLDPQKHQISSEEFTRMMRHQLGLLHMEEEEVVAICQKILLVRKWLSDIGNSVFVDSEVFDNYFNYASKGAEIELYKLGAPLNFSLVDDLLKFELYLDAVAERRSPLETPIRFLSADEVREKAPELLEKRFIIDFTSKEKDEIAVGVSLKESLEWQLQDDHWAELVPLFPALQEFKGTSVEEKHEFLLSLSNQERANIDNYVRTKIIEDRPEKIRETLAQTKELVKQISVPLVKSGPILRTLADHETLLKLLETAPLNDDLADEEGIESAMRLSCYSEDGKTFHRIKILDRDKEYQIIPFEKAKNSSVLEKKLAQRLEAEYEKGAIRGEYEEVLPQLKEAVFAPLLTAIEEEAEVDRSQFEGAEMRLRFAKDHRFDRYMREKLEEAKKGELSLTFDASPPDASRTKLSPVINPDELWKLSRQELKFTRNDATLPVDEGVFELTPSSWSELKKDEQGRPYFYHLLKAFVDKVPIVDRLKKSERYLGQEAQEKSVEKFFDLAVQNHAFIVPKKVQEED